MSGPKGAPLHGEAYARRERLLAMGFCAFVCLLYIPFAGNYGLWDPWETHYGEVARQMVERNDWISLWWPGSPQDAATFWSKPVLTFWIMALSMKLFGLGKPDLAHAAEMVQGWRAEWALRLPFVILGIVGVWSIWHLCRRLVGRGPALWSALILATCTQWALISRQAMTDMAFVTPMTVGLVFAALALLLPRDEMTADLPRRRVRLLGLALEWPHDRSFYIFMVVYVLCVVPQLAIDCVQLQSWTLQFGRHTYRTLGLVAMLPWIALFLVSLWWTAAARDRRTVYLWVTYLMGGIATLAKGPAGIALPVIIIFVFIAVTGRWREFLGRPRAQPWWWGRLLPGPLQRLATYDGGLEVVRGTLLFLCVGAPWYAAMLVRHGAPFWMELIGDNYVHRAQGRHGDRGTYEYYLRQLSLGLFPWPGVVLAAITVSGRWLRQWSSTPRGQLVALCLCWFIVDFMVVALVNTKFHHYILPAIPALAILGGLFVDEICRAARGLIPRDSAIALSLLGLPVTFLGGRDMASFPARIGWLFNYDYVNSPGGGRPWPVVALYGERYEYGQQILDFAWAAALGIGLLCLLLGRGSRGPRPDPGEGPALTPDGAAPGEGDEAGARGPRAGVIAAYALLFVGLLVAGIAIAPGEGTAAYWASSRLPRETVLPRWLRFGWLLPAGAAAAWLGVLVGGNRRRFFGAGRGLRGPLAALLLMAILGIGWNAWVLDRFLIELSPHWSQKSVFATYYRLRKGPEEPVVAWQMYWRGENFYTRNQIYDHRLDQAEKTVFLGDRNSEKLQAYVTSHRGRRIFFLLERNRLEMLRGLLPAESRASLKIVDESNNKVYLVVAQL